VVVTVRGPVAAAVSMEMLAVRLVAFVTVTLFTVMPRSKTGQCRALRKVGGLSSDLNIQILLALLARVGTYRE